MEEMVRFVLLRSNCSSAGSVKDCRSPTLRQSKRFDVLDFARPHTENCFEPFKYAGSPAHDVIRIAWVNAPISNRLPAMTSAWKSKTISSKLKSESILSVVLLILRFEAALNPFSSIYLFKP